MRKRISRKVVIIVAAAIIIAIIGVIGVNAAHSNGPVASAFNTVFRPFQSLNSKIVDMYESLYGYMYKYDTLVEENETLRKENTELKEGYLQYEEIVEENQRLKQLLDFRDHHEGYVFEQATLLSWGASNWSRTFTVNLGSENSEIAVGDCVITEAGTLVGLVTHVDSNASTVKSIIDTTFSASVDVGSGNTVTASGDFSLMSKGMLKISYLEEGTGIASGDSVVTSGKGGVFPQGLLIGYVDGLYSEAGNLSMYGSVRPAVDLNDILYVFVITDFNG